MNILILYHSGSGRTEGLAREIAVNCGIGFRLLHVLLRNTEQSPLMIFCRLVESWLDLLSITAPCLRSLKKVLDESIPIRKKLENKVGAAFTTCNFHTGGKETTLMSILQALLISGMIVVGDPMSASGHYGVAFSGDIDDTIVSHARELGKRVAELAKVTAPFEK